MRREPSSDLFLLVIAIFKLAKAIFFIFLGIALLHFIDRDVVSRMQSFMGSLHVDEDNHVAKWVLGKASQLTNTRLVTLSAICFFYATLDLIEPQHKNLLSHWISMSAGPTKDAGIPWHWSSILFRIAVVSSLVGAKVTIPTPLRVSMRRTISSRALLSPGKT